jgi:hypothetical protein
MLLKVSAMGRKQPKMAANLQDRTKMQAVCMRWASPALLLHNQSTWLPLIAQLYMPRL